MAGNAAHAEAVSHFQQALELLRTIPSEEGGSRIELDLFLGMAVSLSASKGYCAPAVGSSLEAARKIAESMGDINSLFAILRGNCNFKIVAGEMAEAESIALRCMEIAETTGLLEHRIEAHLPLGWVLFAMGRFTAAYHHLNQAVRLYDEHDGIHLHFPTAQDPKIASLSALLLVLMALGYEQEEALAVSHLQAHIKLLDSSFDAVFGFVFLAWHAMDRERYQECLDFASQALELCDQNGYRYHGYGARIYQAVSRAHLNICSPTEAISQAEEGIRSLTELDANHALPHRMSALSSLYAMTGDLDRASSLNHQALKLAHQKQDDFSVPMIVLRQWAIDRQICAVQQGPGQADLIQTALEAAEQMGATGLCAMIRNKVSGSVNQARPE
jgi:tetratricopeptide (TPR) repeat protein